MLNFAVGPVMPFDETRRLGSEPIPYFRTDEFSKMMFETERLFLKFLNAPMNSKAVFLTGSGTASMEASIINTIRKEDKILVVNGGSFGKRFVEILDVYDFNYSEIILEPGEPLTAEELTPFENSGFTVFVINMHETSTGVLYDMGLVSEFCKRNHLFLIVDAISCFLTDWIDMEAFNIDIVISSSQKALSCPPGLSLIALSPVALKRIQNNDNKCYYFDLKKALKDMERGQTPFTPAVGILIQIHNRFLSINKNGGIAGEIERVKNIATYFREKIAKFPFSFFSKSMSNAVTSLQPLKGSAYNLFKILKDDYGIWICPNGGLLKEKVFRVGHMGNITFQDIDQLINAFDDLSRRGLL